MNTRIVLLLAILILPGALAYDVELVRQTPVYTWKDIPYSNNHNYYPFGNSKSVGDYFTISGPCCDGRTGCSGLETAGLYILKTDGTYVGKRDICHDARKYRSFCNEAGGCDHGLWLIPTADGHFLAVGGGDGASAAIQYDAATAQLLGRTHYDTWHGEGLQFRNGQWTTDGQKKEAFVPGDILAFSDIAYASGHVVGVETQYGGKNIYGSPQYWYVNAIYSLDMQRLAEFSKGNKEPLYRPIVGVGEYFIAGSGLSGYYAPPYTVYRMPAAAQLQQGQRPEAVQTLDVPLVWDYAIDPTNRGRIAILWPENKREQRAGGIAVYEAGPAGLTNVANRSLPADFPTNQAILTIGKSGTFAIAGQYFVYAPCSAPRTTSCSLVVEKDGRPLSVEPLPLDTGLDQSITTVALASDGRILVTTYTPNGAENGRAYVYRIKNFGSTAPTPSNVTPTITAGGPNRFVYKTGYYLENNAWKPFTFSTATVAGSNWIRGTATATLAGAPSEGYVLAYICKRAGAQWTCGPARAGEANARRWTIRAYNLTGAGGSPNGSGALPTVRFDRKAYAREDIPWQTVSPAYLSIFHNVEWLSGGYFVAGGHCDPGAGQTKQGMYVLKEDGSFVGKRNVCYDTRTTQGSCPEGGGCQTGNKIQELTPTMFVRDMQDVGSLRRAPALYEVQPTGVSLGGIVFPQSAADTTWPGLYYLKSIAVADGKLVAMKVDQNYDHSKKNIAIYSLPGLTLLDEYPSDLIPITGIGDRIIAMREEQVTDPVTGKGARNNVIGAYRVVNNQLQLESVIHETLGGPFREYYAEHYTIDSAGRERFALQFGKQGAPSGSACILVFFELGTAGITKTDEREFPFCGPFAIAGDYLAIYSLPSGSNPSPGLKVWKGTQELVVEQSAELLAGRAGTGITSLAMSPGGTIIVANSGLGLYRFTISGGSGGSGNGSDGTGCNVCTPGQQRCDTGGTYLEICKTAADGCARWFPQLCQNNQCSGNSCPDAGSPSPGQPTCSVTNNEVCSNSQVANAQANSGWCNSFGIGQAPTCYRCASGYVADWSAAACVPQGQPTSACETSPGMFCILEPDGSMQYVSGKHCDFSGVPGSAYYTAKGCYQCKQGTYDPSTKKCVGSGAQNLKIKDIGMQVIGGQNHIYVEICKELDTPLTGTVSVTVRSDRSADWSPLELTVVPACAAGSTKNWHTELSRIMDAPLTGQRQVTVTAVFPSEHNGVTTDDTMTKTFGLSSTPRAMGGPNGPGGSGIYGTDWTTRMVLDFYAQSSPSCDTGVQCTGYSDEVQGCFAQGHIFAENPSWLCETIPGQSAPALYTCYGGQAGKTFTAKSGAKYCCKYTGTAGTPHGHAFISGACA